MIRVKRVYDPPAKADGCRILVDRLWPRGLTREKAALDLWLREVAPSDELRHWYSHAPERWPEFQKRYRAEIEAHAAALEPLKERIAAGDVTLLFSSKEAELNNAVALKAYLEAHAAKAKPPRRRS